MKITGRDISLPKLLILTVCCSTASGTALAEQNGHSVTGAMLYHTHCASCHGDQARGDGMVGKALRTPPADLTRLAQKNGGVFLEAEVGDYIDGTRDVTAHGPRTMPVWGMIFENKETIRKLVAYLRGVQQQP
jgi:mono/diheme cytochrome c family protein